MKKYLLTIMALLFVLVLSSCNKTKEIKKIEMLNNQLTTEETQALATEYISNYGHKNYSFYEDYYKIELVSKGYTKHKAQEIYYELYVKGKTFDSKIGFDCKMKLDIVYDIKIVDPDTSKETNILLEGEAILIDSICYYNVKLNGNTDGGGETGKIKTHQKIKMNFSDFIKDSNINDLLNFSSNRPIFAQYNDDFFNTINTKIHLSNLTVYKEDNNYSLEIKNSAENKKENLQYLIETDEEFNTTRFESYQYEYSYTSYNNVEAETEVRCSFKKIRNADFKLPLDYKKYRDEELNLPIEG